MEMEKSDKTPMYQYIMNDIKRKIAAGELKPHDPLPTQIELAKEYNTSEITSRRALSDLVQEGFVYRIRGKGSFVHDNPSAADSQAIRVIYFAHRNHEVGTFIHPFFTDMFDGIREVCEENGIIFYMWDMGENYNLPDDPHAGIVLLTLTEKENFDLTKLTAWQDENRRFLTVHFYYPHLGIPYVIVDNLTGGYLATQHLISQGHQRIGVILTGSSILDINQEFSLRLQGYKLALSQHQIPFNSDLITVISGEDERVSMGEEGFKRLMALPDPPTAVFATSDYKAFGAMNAAREMGMKIPADISIIGYDDVMISEYSYPRLTSVNQNTRKLGRRAAEMLLFELGESGAALLKDEIVPTLTLRDSTAPPSSKKETGRDK